MPIQFVEQTHSAGCSIACLAMVMGRTYEDVCKDFYTDFNDTGILNDVMVEYLSDFGYQTLTIELKSWSDPHFAFDILSRPYAPMHILSVKQYAESKNLHSIVMDIDGTIYNPNKNGWTDISKYYQIFLSIGVWPK
jgi:hypothetical protein